MRPTLNPIRNTLCHEFISMPAHGCSTFIKMHSMENLQIYPRVYKLCSKTNYAHHALEMHDMHYN